MTHPRLLDAVSEDDLRPTKICSGASASAQHNDGHGDKWCLRFRGKSGDPKGCGPSPDAWCGEMPDDDAILSRRAYAASVNFVDEWVGHIYDTLEERNLLERTWILWTSDHGDGQGDMYHWRKGYPYEFSAHVPMLLRWPESWAATQPAGSIVARGSILEPPVVTELRDVLHTMVDAAGLAGSLPAYDSGAPSAFAAEDGKSMLCLLRDPTGKTNCDYAPNPGPWRQWLDLEHAQCYNMSNHWSALTDGKIKYIYRAWADDEQLFDLAKDPSETEEVSSKAEYAEALALWRSRMVSQFEAEGRGAKWVKDGKLVRRTKSTTYSPNYPSAPAPTPLPTPVAGDIVVMHANGGTAPPGCGTNDCWVLQARAGGTELRMIDATSLCLAMKNETSLEVQKCDGGDAQQFSTQNHTSTLEGSLAAIKHEPSGRCVVAVTASGEPAQLASCAADADEQKWLFGSSGRLCASKKGGLCLRADVHTLFV